MAKRAGLSLSVKMILTTTFLILITVVGFGALNTCNIRDAYDKSAGEKIEVFRQQLESKGEATTQVFASALVPFLINNQDAEIQQLVEKSLKQDPTLKLVYVLARDKKLISYCKRKDDKCDRGEYPVEMHVDVKHESWSKISDTWQGRGTKNEADPQVSGALRCRQYPTRPRASARPVYKRRRACVRKGLDSVERSSGVSCRARDGDGPTTCRVHRPRRADTPPLF